MSPRIEASIESSLPTVRSRWCPSHVSPRPWSSSVWEAVGHGRRRGPADCSSAAATSPGAGAADAPTAPQPSRTAIRAAA